MIDAARAAEGALARLSAQQPATLLGWFVCRGGTQLAASAREQASRSSDDFCPDAFTKGCSKRAEKRWMPIVAHTPAPQSLAACWHLLWLSASCCIATTAWSLNEFGRSTSDATPCAQAVAASLAGVLSRQRQGHRSDAEAAPLLFALCSAGQQQGGATCSFQYRFFQLSQAVRTSHKTLCCHSP